LAQVVGRRVLPRWAAQAAHQTQMGLPRNKGGRWVLACLLADLAVGTIALRRTRAQPIPALMTPAAQTHQACLQMVGTYESGTERITVLPPQIYIAQGGSVSHSEGKIVHSTDCTCSGKLDFHDGTQFAWTYDLWTCALTWSTAPSVDKPYPEEVNVWVRDGSCGKPPTCSPTADQKIVQVSEAGVQQATTLATESATMAIPAAEALKAVTVQVSALSGSVCNEELMVDAALRSLKKAATMFATGNATNATAGGAPAAAPAAAPPAAAPALLQRRATVDPNAKLIKRVSGCQGLAGTFESSTAVAEVHDDAVFISGSGATHAQGQVTSQTECSCGGTLLYPDIGDFLFKYDLFTCEMVWLNLPTMEHPHPQELNRWAKDGFCTTRQQCSPDALKAEHAPKGLYEKALKAQQAALLVLDATSQLTLVVSSVVGMVEQKSVPKLDPAVAATAAEQSEAILGAAQKASSVVTMTNPSGRAAAGRRVGEMKNMMNDVATRVAALG